MFFANMAHPKKEAVQLEMKTVGDGFSLGYSQNFFSKVMCLIYKTYLFKPLATNIV